MKILLVVKMSRHREAWEERKRHSEGKLESLRKKVDNLDELVNVNSFCNSDRRKSLKIIYIKLC